MFKRILVAVDGSRSALGALEHAIKLQVLTGAEIYLLCVYKHHSLFESSLSMVRPTELQIPDQALNEFAREVINHAREYAHEHGASNVRGFVKAGRPSKTIVEFAHEKEVGLIVLGTHGTHSKDGMILGSVAHRVASSAKCPVLIV